MQTMSLQSGSNGNCIYVEAGETRLLFDAGITGRQAELRLLARGRHIRECHALFLSHDHSDHTSCAGVFHRRFGIPLFMTKGVYRTRRDRIGPVRPPTWFSPGDCVTIGDVRVQTIPTLHDGVDGVCFLVEHDGRRLGIFTDLGAPFLALGEALSRCHGAFLESNSDPQMLETGRYTDDLKRRIRGGHGHLSNVESADLSRGYATATLGWLALAHLSEDNNTPALALETHQQRGPALLPTIVASRYGPSELLDV